MIEFSRKMWKNLVSWRQSPHRKPLIIRGARQVGKTTLVRQFGASYPHFIELNLEKKEYRQIFEKSDRLSDILNAIFLQTNTPKTGRETLLFLDEVQESPFAIRLLANHFSVEEAKTPGGTPYYLLNLPYYLACKLPEYATWMIQKYGHEPRP
jgi:predicted AAA+ superfamily ATPase